MASTWQYPVKSAEDILAMKPVGLITALKEWASAIADKKLSEKEARIFKNSLNNAKEV